MSSDPIAATKAAPVEEDITPSVPPKDRSPSPDTLLQEEPLEGTTATTTTTAPVRPGGTLSTTNSGVTPHARVEDVVDEAHAPPKPPRPVSQFDRDVATLKEAFPDVDLAVVKAVLTASGGKVEPAFNALLGMSDPSFVAEEEEAPPPQPPRPRQGFQSSPQYQEPGLNQATSTPLNQLEADELYARQLAEHYGGSTQPATTRRHRGEGQPPQQPPRPRPANTNPEQERSFLDDELPIITENIKKGFIETQSKVNKWVEGFKKRLDGEDIDTTNSSQGHPNAASRANQSAQQSYPQRQSSRRSGDNYDADPRLLEDDFSHLELRDNSAAENRQSTRPLANPNLFNSTTTSGGGAPAPRRVSFQDQSDEDLYRQPTPRSTMQSSTVRASSPNTTATSTTATGSKWAPLATVEPTPLNSDPFSLGDSDDEHDAPTVAGGVGKTGPQETGTIGGGGVGSTASTTAPTTGAGTTNVPK